MPVFPCNHTITDQVSVFNITSNAWNNCNNHVHDAASSFITGDFNADIVLIFMNFELEYLVLTAWKKNGNNRKPGVNLFTQLFVFGKLYNRKQVNHIHSILILKFNAHFSTNYLQEGHLFIVPGKYQY